ncbi:MAG: hypothetical protein HY854_21935 [Burkholderiales bacterium]|nr:hypothetical protein [Burkholderiales bacterium]
MLPAEAFTLGRPRATVVLGRPLQVTIPIQLDDEEAELCTQAELFQGDTRSGPLEVLLERSAEGWHQLRVRSTVVIEEPVINVYLRVGCTQQSTRSFAFLSEQVLEASSGPLSLTPSLALSAPTVTPAAPEPSPAQPATGTLAPVAQPVAPAAIEGGPPARASNQRTAGTPPKRAQAPRERSARAPRAPRPDATGAGKPRLKLEAIDAAVESAPALKLSPMLSAGSSGTPTQRAEAAAAWKGLNVSQDEQVARAKRSEALESEVKALREAMQKHTSSLTALSDQLEKVRGERDIASSLVLVFAGGLAMGFAFMLWLRWRDSSAREARWKEVAALHDNREDARPSVRRKSVRGGVEEIDSDWTGIDSAVDGEHAEPVRSKPVALGPVPEFAESEGASRLPRAEELLDIKLRTDFFLAIGEHERAVELLEAQIHDHLGSSPVIWLDLLDICHKFGRAEDYERLRREYQALFNARLPAFEANRPSNGGLEEHPRALSRIVLLWPSPRVLKVIEDALFETQSTPNAVAFDLAASRDLLLLYGIAREVIRQRIDEGVDEPLPSRPASFAPSGPSETTEPIPLVTLDEAPAGAPPPVAPDLDLDFVNRPRSGSAPGPAATPPPAEYDYAFEPADRVRAR